MPNTPRQESAEEARKIAHHAILNLKKYMGGGAAAEWLRSRADAIERADLAIEKMEGLTERHEEKKSPMMREFEERMRTILGKGGENKA